MSVGASFEETHERILQAALEIFSEQGYADATIRAISVRAGCNAVTVFRHFTDKRTLFLQVVERFHALTLDEETLQSRLSYINVHADLSLIAGCFFDLLFQHIHIMRIFIHDSPAFEEIARWLWFLPVPFKDFVREYLLAIYQDAIPVADAALIAEMFVSYITRTCLRITVHDGVLKHSRQVSRQARATMTESVDMIAKLCLLQVERAGGGG